MKENDMGELPRGVGTVMKGGKLLIAEFQVQFEDGKPFAIVGKVAGGRLIEKYPLDPNCLHDKTSPFQYFYTRQMDWDRKS